MSLMYATYESNPEAFADNASADQLKQLGGFQQFTPEQVQEYMAYMQGGPAPAWLQGGKGIYPDSTGGMWWGPQAAPHHTDNGSPLSAENLLTGQVNTPYGETAQSAWNDMRNGAAIMALPFVGAGITALGAGAAGASAGGLGTEGFGLGEAYGGMAAPEVGGSGVGVGGGFGGAAASDAMPAAQAEDVFGGYNIDPETGDVFHGTGDNPFGSNFNGGTGNEGFNGYQPGFLEQAQSQASSLAKQFGLTPASALQAVLKAAGRAAPAALGAVAANNQANSLNALAEKYMALGAPSRARYEASFAPGFTMANDPGYQGALDQSAKATLHGLSVNGNPASSPNAWSRSLQDLYDKTAYPALQNFRNTNANAGGIATLQTAAPGAATGAIAAQGNVFNAIGAGANDIFNPPQSLAQQLAEYQRLLKAQGSGAVV